MCEPQDREKLLVLPTLAARLLLKMQAFPFYVFVWSWSLVPGVPSAETGETGDKNACRIATLLSWPYICFVKKAFKERLMRKM